jgi:hypothetical protein
MQAMKQIIFFTAICFFLSSCVNIDKLIDRGEYDSAIDKLIDKLEGNNKKKKEHVLALEYAFQKAQTRDLNAEKSLRDENLPENWAKIYSIHNSISARQNKIEPFLPLKSTDGYQATFKFVNIEELKKESKKNTAEFYYQSALTLIDEAKKSLDKKAAQKAYEYLVKIDGILNQYKDKEQLKKIAYNLGLENFLLKINNNTKNIIPENIETELLRISVDGLNTKYKNFDVKANPTVQYDRFIIMNLTQLEFSPERERSRVYDDVNEVESTEVVKDRNGKPKRDSLGKEIKEKIKTKYVATIEEITQSKSVLLGGRLEYIHAITGDVEFSKPINVEGLFENHLARLIKGDQNYVTSDCRKKLNGKLVSFPSNEELLLNAAEKMKKLVKDIIYDREH